MVFNDVHLPAGMGNVPLGPQLKELQKIHKNFKLIIREKKLGLDTAHKRAFNYAKENNYDYLITMDIDSHEPKTITEIIKRIRVRL